MTDYPTEYLKFFYIPSCALLNEKIPYAAAVLFSIILGLIKGNGKCTAQNAYFRRFLRGECSDAYIQKCLSALEDEEYITREIVKNKVIDDNGKVKFETKREIRICTVYESKHADLIPQLGKLNENNNLIDPPKPIVEGGKKPIVSIDSNRVSNILSKESKKVSPSIDIDPELLFLLEEWRKFKHIPKSQHHPREGTKKHLKIANLTKWLLNGTFINHCDLKQDFLQPLGLTKAKLNRKYSKDELLAGLDEMAEMFKENNLPEDKTKICGMGFDQLIYHPIAKISYLIKFMYSDAKSPTYKTVQVYDHWLERVYKEGLFDRDIENDNYQFGLLKKGLAGIEDYHDWLIETVHPIPSHIRKQDQFFNMYIEWVLNYNSSVNVHSIGTNNGRWWVFIKWLEEAIYGDYIGSSPSLDRRQYK